MPKKRASKWTRKKHTKAEYEYAQRMYIRRFNRIKTAGRTVRWRKAKIERYTRMFYDMMNAWSYENCNRSPIPFEMLDPELRIVFKRLALKHHRNRKKWTRQKPRKTYKEMIAIYGGQKKRNVV